MSRANLIRSNISERVDDVITDIGLVDFDLWKNGKIRDLYRAEDPTGQDVLLMVTSDRVSAFDHVLDRAIPYKGAVLNAIAEQAFGASKHTVPNVLMSSPHPNVMVQRELTHTGVECIVRGYMWGSMAKGYEAGDQEKCGIELPDGMLRYEKLRNPIFTPTTKTENDEDLTFGEMVGYLGKNLAESGVPFDKENLSRLMRNKSLVLFSRASQRASKVGLGFVDTKYEFGLDEEGRLYLIDEVDTPDSSRFMELDDWKSKWPRIRNHMGSGMWDNVNGLISDHPEIKIRELSKQVVRDYLLERGFDSSSGMIPKLDDEVVVETAARYVELYERLSGKEFDFTRFDNPLSINQTLLDVGYRSR
jgi:phosphoribosylaminoimidazole-succinocarboxamide synthase